MRIRTINIKGELFTSTMTYGLAAVVKLGSSLILTRLLSPEAYGVLGILFSIAFTLELMSDVGTSALLVRHERGSDHRFIHTLWTVRLVRACVNFILLYTLAPAVAHLFDSPLLSDALRLFSWWFLIAGFESMAFIVAQRRQRSRIGNYVDLATTLVMTIFVIGIAAVLRDHTAFIYGALLQRLLSTVVSHLFYREIGVAIAFDRAALKDQFNLGKIVLPSSLLTIMLTQYDKVVLLKLSDLTTLGLYGLAISIVSPMVGMINHNCRVVLYPRCAEYFRASPQTAGRRYYLENARLLNIVTLPPMVIAGLSQSIIAMLYDLRYRPAGLILMTLAVNAFLGSIQSASENLLVASGRTGVVLGANILRVATILPLTLGGFYFFGFFGFLWASVLATLPVLMYYYREQFRSGLLDWRSELSRFVVGVSVFAMCWLVSFLALKHIPADLLH